MEELDILLSDKFAEFSQKVTEIATQKRNRTVEFKAMYESYTGEMKSLDQQVIELQRDFEAWKRERATSATDS